MPAVSKKQQRFFGIVRAAQKGTLKGKKTLEVQRAASSMKKKDVKKFASTKHKGLPEKKVTKESFNEDYVKELEDGLVKLDYPTYDEVDELMKKIAKDNGIDTTVLHMAFKTKHLMVPDDWAKKKMLEPVMIPKTPKDMECEENLLEYDGNYHMNKIAKERGLDLTDPRQRRRANSLARKNAAKGNVNNPAGFSKRKKRTKIAEEGLRDWFGKSKSKDGKGGWVNVVTGGTCASDEPGEGTPKCVSSSKRASMTKAERLSAQRRKKAADPGQQSKKNAAKPTYVSTDSPKKKKKVNEAYGGKGVSRKAKLASTHPPTAQAAIKNIPTETDRGAGNKAKRRSGQKVEKKSPSYKAYINNKEEYINEALPLKSGAKVGRKFIIGKIGKQYTRDEYGDPIKKDGSSALKKNVDKNPKDDKTPNNLVGEEKKIKNKLKKTAKELDAAVVMHTKQAKRLRAIVEDGKDLTGNFEKGDKPVKVNIKNLLDKVKKNPKNKNIGVKPPINTNEAKVTSNHATIGGEHAKDKKASETGLITSSDHPDRRPKKKVEPQPIKRERGQVMQDSYEPIVEFKKSPAWQRKAGKSESGGLNAKGVASYRRANPGSKLKTAVTTKPSKLKKGSKSAKRRLSFCRRMRGMKKKLTSAKTARDPDSRINKALRKWNCSFEYESGQMIIERGPQSLGSGARQKSPHAKEGKKGTKKVSGMIKSLKRKGSILKQPLGGPADAASKARRLSYVKAGDDVDLTILRLINEGHMNKTCAKGEYYCYNSKKCKPIPKGMRIGYGGMLKPENENDESNGKKGGSNGNGNGNGGNGNGNGGNGNGGNGGGE